MQGMPHASGSARFAARGSDSAQKNVPDPLRSGTIVYYRGTTHFAATGDGLLIGSNKPQVMITEPTVATY